jgi:hypothetical protein
MCSHNSNIHFLCAAKEIKNISRTVHTSLILSSQVHLNILLGNQKQTKQISPFNNNFSFELAMINKYYCNFHKQADAKCVIKHKWKAVYESYSVLQVYQYNS